MKTLVPITALLGFAALAHGQTNLTITTQPQSQTVPAGATVIFSVAVNGPGPLGYQWQFNGTNLPGGGIITTFAGNGNLGYAGNGTPATNASFIYPWGLSLDASGNLFIVDSWDNRIREVGTNGIITTIAGNGYGAGTGANGAYSGDGGPATNASLFLSDGWGVGSTAAVDAFGNVFISDVSNNRVRRVAPNGIIVTVAGTGAIGSSGDGGPATNASLSYPEGVAVDNAGNLYIAEHGGSRVRKVDTNGIISTVAGNGTAGYSGDGFSATNARLNSPTAIAVDAGGDLFIADYANGRIRKVDTNGVITTVAGNGGGGFSGDGGAATNATISAPVGVTVDAAGDLFIVDLGNERIREVSADGIINTVAGGGTGGLGDGGSATSATLNYPGGVAVDGSGDVYISDSHNQRVRKVVSEAGPTLTIPNVTMNNAGNYTVIVSNGSQSVTSSVAVLQINSSILVNGQLAAGTVYSESPAEVSFVDAFPNGFFFYTLDGTTPTTSSQLYFGPFSLTNSAIVRVLNVNSNDSQSVLSPQVNVQIGTAPIVTIAPTNEVLAVGSPLSLTASASGTAPLAYQWWRSSGAIAGATNAVFTIASVSTNDADNYFATVSSLYGSATSAVATVTVYLRVTITSPPTNQVVPLGGTATFSVSASGFPAPSYQWSFNGTNLPGATSNNLTINHVQLTNCGAYQVLASNAYNSQPGGPATLSMSPSITAPFSGATAIWGRSASLSVGAIGSGTLTYQWYLNGAAVGGATNAILNLSSVQFTNGGLYTVVVSSAFGSATNTPALLVVNPAGTSLGIYAGVTLTGVAGYSYIIQYTTDLTKTNSWVTLTNLTLDQPVEIWVDTTTNALATRRFYQVLPGQ